MVISGDFINNFVLILILTIVHITAIVFAWRVGNVSGTSKSWVLILTAFIILLARRVISFLELFGKINYSDFTMLLDRIYLPIIFWALISIGMFKMFSKIRSSIEFERRTRHLKK